MVRKIETARFWVWHNCSPVRLSVKVDQVLEFRAGGPDDEGYSCEASRFTFDGETVFSSYDSWGRDCDGPHRFQSDSVAAVCALNAGAVDSDYPDISYPAWSRASSEQRDVFAELAGY